MLVGEVQVPLPVIRGDVVAAPADVVGPWDVPGRQAANAVPAAPSPKSVRALRRLSNVVRSKANPWSKGASSGRGSGRPSKDAVVCSSVVMAGD